MDRLNLLEHFASFYLARLAVLCLKRSRHIEDMPTTDQDGPWLGMNHSVVCIDGLRYLRDGHGRMVRELTR